MKNNCLNASELKDVFETAIIADKLPNGVYINELEYYDDAEEYCHIGYEHQADLLPVEVGNIAPKKIYAVGQNGCKKSEHLLVIDEDGEVNVFENDKSEHNEIHRRVKSGMPLAAAITLTQL